MIVVAVLCPGTPLLVPEVSGADGDAAALRAAASSAVDELLGARPEVVAVVGAAADTASWPADARADLAAFGVPVGRVSRAAPLSVGLGALLLDRAGYAGPMALRTVAATASGPVCEAVAADASTAAGRVGLLVVADGSARRTTRAPGYYDPRALPYDQATCAAIAAGDLTGLRALDPDLARELMASWAPLQVLAAAFGADRPHTTIHYADAPFGVGYLVATIRSVR